MKNISENAIQPPAITETTLDWAEIAIRVSDYDSLALAFVEIASCVPKAPYLLSSLVYIAENYLEPRKEYLQTLVTAFHDSALAFDPGTDAEKQLAGKFSHYARLLPPEESINVFRNTAIQSSEKSELGKQSTEGFIKATRDDMGLAEQMNFLWETANSSRENFDFVDACLSEYYTGVKQEQDLKTRVEKTLDIIRVAPPVDSEAVTRLLPNLYEDAVLLDDVPLKIHALFRVAGRSRYSDELNGKALDEILNNIDNFKTRDEKIDTCYSGARIYSEPGSEFESLFTARFVGYVEGIRDIFERCTKYFEAEGNSNERKITKAAAEGYIRSVHSFKNPSKEAGLFLQGALKTDEGFVFSKVTTQEFFKTLELLSAEEKRKWLNVAVTDKHNYKTVSKRSRVLLEDMDKPPSPTLPSEPQAIAFMERIRKPQMG